MNVIFETPIAVGQVEPPYTFVFIAKRLLTEEMIMKTKYIGAGDI